MLIGIVADGGSGAANQPQPWTPAGFQVERDRQIASREENATTWYHPAQNLALFDVGSSNLIWSTGHLFPIDIIPVRPAGHMREMLRQFVRAD